MTQARDKALCHHLSVTRPQSQTDEPGGLPLPLLSWGAELGGSSALAVRVGGRDRQGRRDAGLTKKWQTPTQYVAVQSSTGGFRILAPWCILGVWKTLEMACNGAKGAQERAYESVQPCASLGRAYPWPSSGCQSWSVATTLPKAQNHCLNHLHHHLGPCLQCTCVRALPAPTCPHTPFLTQQPEEPLEKPRSSEHASLHHETPPTLPFLLAKIRTFLHGQQGS